MYDILSTSKSLGIQHNVNLRVINEITGEIVQEHQGHNMATNAMLTGIAHFLTGDSVLNQGQFMLDEFVPKYISLGTMGLSNQKQDSSGLPSGITSYADYYNSRPGFGADGYDSYKNNNRAEFGLGLPYTTYVPYNIYLPGDIVTYQGQRYRCKSETTSEWDEDSWQVIDTLIAMELISPEFPRSEITFRDIVPETESELPSTIDVVFSAMVSTGALKTFRKHYGTKGQDPGYIFITEAGLWSKKAYNSSGHNGLLAGYRIVPPNPSERTLSGLKNQILRVGINEVVQVIWKVQLGSIDDIAQNIQSANVPVICTTTGKTYSNLLAAQGSLNIPWEDILLSIQSGRAIRNLNFQWA